MPLHGPFTGQKRPHFLPPELRMFGVGSFCVEAAIAFIFIAAPVYLYQFAINNFLFLQQLPLSEISIGLIGLCLFYITQRIGCVLFLPVATKTIEKLGFTPALIIGSLVYLIKYSLFPLFPTYPWLFFVTALLSGYGLITYWVSSFTILSSSLIKKQEGQEIGSFEFVSKLAQILAPLLGALLSAQFGFMAPALAAGFFFILGAISFLHIPPLKTSGEWSFGKYFQWIKDKYHWRMSVAIGAFQWERFGTAVFWPVFLFLTFERIESVGYILSTATLLSLMFVYVTGWVFDQSKHKNWLRMSTGTITGLLWIPRMLLLGNPLTLVINDSLDRIMKGMYSTVFTTIMMLQARSGKVYEFMVHREVTLSFSTISMLSLFAGLLFFGAPWQVALATFVIASLTSLILSGETPKEKG